MIHILDDVTQQHRIVVHMINSNIEFNLGIPRPPYKTCMSLIESGEFIKLFDRIYQLASLTTCHVMHTKCIIKPNMLCATYHLAYLPK